MIDCEGSGRGFAYVVGETAASELAGLTIRNGNPGFSGDLGGDQVEIPGD